MCEFANNTQHGRIDRCMKRVIGVLRDAGINTVACCCGHGDHPTTILVKERDGVVRDLFTGAMIPRKRRYYVRDTNGRYYVPEVPTAMNRQPTTA